MNRIEDIFSSEKTKKEILCPNPKIEIIVDTREKQSFVAANLFEQKANIKFEKLEIADYKIGNILIERKTASDFVSSILNKRLLVQLKELKEFDNKFIIIEGQLNNQKFLNENAVRGMLISIALDFKIPIINTLDEKDTSKFLVTTAKRLEKTKTLFSLRVKKKSKNIEDEKRFILEGFPGIGPSISRRLLEKFKNLKNIFNLKEEDLRQIEKFDENKIKRFIEILN